MPVDEFSIENMKAELARATNRRTDVLAMIKGWSESNPAVPAEVLIRAIEKRMQEL